MIQGRSCPLAASVVVLTFTMLMMLLPAHAAAVMQPAIDVAGRVEDTSGAAIAGAHVEALAAGSTVAEATTTADGRYALQVPAAVPLMLRATRDGFAEAVVDLPGRTEPITRNIVLRIGSLSDTLVVTASRGAESRTNVTQSVTVATTADMQALGSASLADVIRFVPGVNIESTGREGALTSMFSRGGESDYNLVLIDGVRANISGGAFDFSRIATGEIDRVEVVRGAQSSLWGSDAIGSVVQIFTKRASETDTPQLSSSLEGGSFNSWRGDLRVGGGARRRFNYQVGTTYRHSNGAFADLLPQDDRFDQRAVDGSIGATIGTRANVRTSLRYSDGDGRSVGPIDYGSRDSGGVYDTKDFSWTTSITHAVGSRYTGTGSGNYFRYSNQSGDTIVDPAYGTYTILAGTPNALFPNGSRLVRVISQGEFTALSAAGALPAPGQFLASRTTTDSTFTSATEFRRPAFRYQGDYAWAGGQRFSAGYEWEHESNPLVNGISLDNNAAFVQQQFSLAERWFLTVGGRVDRKESYDTFFSPKASGGGFLVPFRGGTVSSLKLSANLGRGIKSPTFGERFGGSFADPDPNLKVESARTADVGAEVTFIDQRLRGSITYFDNAYTDQIAYRPGIAGDGIPEYINIDGSAAHGWELEAALQRPFGGVTASATYALVDTEVVTNVSTSQQFQPGQPLLRRPKHSGSVRAALVSGRFTVNANLRIVGRRHDNSFLSLRTVPNVERPAAIITDITVNPGYAVAGLGVDYRAHSVLTVFLRGDNIGDKRYESVLGYPGLPRAVVLGARLRIGMRPQP